MKNNVKFKVLIAMAIVIMFSSFGSFTSEAAGYKTVYVLSKITYPSFGSNWEVVFSYNKKGFVTKQVQNTGDFGGSFTYSYNSSNYIKSAYCTSDNTADYTQKFYYKKGKLKKKVTVREDKTSVNTYYWKKNHLRKMTLKPGLNGPIVTTYKHDSKGNICKQSEKLYQKDYKLKYKNGRLVSIDKGYNVRFYYKKIKVSKKNISKIKKQQWLFINGFI
ncbi:MAG: hypothetical protein K6F55_06795 [Eubacterium sp.]|nr:hypothetical protein [Eubacterium sp.]